MGDTCITAWYGILQEEKKLKAAEAEMQAKEAQMSEFQKRKKEEAKAVFARVAAANDNGLLDTCLTGWNRVLLEEKSIREAEEKLGAAGGQMSEFQQRKKEEAKAVFARMAAANETGLLDTCLTAWYRDVKEEKLAREAEARLTAADGKMKEWQQKKKEEAKAVFARMAAGNDMALLDTCITAWGRVVQEEKRNAKWNALQQKK